MKSVVIIVALLSATAVALAASDGPMKRGRAAHESAKKGRATDEAASAAEKPAAMPPAPPTECQERLDKIAVFQALGVLPGPGNCGAADVVRLEAVTLSDQTRIAVNPPATLRCVMAEQVATWVREDIAAAATKLGAPLRGIDNFDSYECRGRNRVAGAKISEHGRANALDVRGFRIGSGKTIELTDVNLAKDWREALRAAACARFTTVLGPGSDGYHENHIHLDLAERRGGYRICEWDVRDAAEEAALRAARAAKHAAVDVPLPRPRPVVEATEDVGKARGRKRRAFPGSDRYRW